VEVPVLVGDLGRRLVQDYLLEEGSLLPAPSYGEGLDHTSTKDQDRWEHGVEARNDQDYERLQEPSQEEPCRDRKVFADRLSWLVLEALGKVTDKKWLT
jgi:hypothetical protein